MRSISFLSALLFALLQATMTNAQNEDELADFQSRQKYFELAKNFKETSLDSALKYASAAYEHYTTKAQLDSQIIAGQLYAKILNKLARNDQGLTVTLELIPLAEASGQKELLAKCYDHAGKIYADMFLYNDAKSMFERAYSLYLLSDTANAYNQLSNLAVIKTQLKSYDEALIDHKIILNYRRNQDNHNDLAISLINVGSLFTLLERYDSSIYYLQSALALRDNVKPLTTQYTLHYLTRAYQAKSDFESAFRYGHESLELARQIKMPMRVAYAAYQLVELSKLTGDFEGAFNYQAIADSISNLTFHNNYTKNVSDSRAKFEADEKQGVIEELSSKTAVAQQIKRVLIFLAIVLLSVIIFQLYKYRNKRKALNKQVEKMKAKRLKVLQELEFKKNAFTTNSLNLLQKDKLMMDLKQNLNGVRKNNDLNEEANEELRLLVQKLDFNSNLERSWRDFRLHFEQIHGNFTIALSRKFPSLSENELRFCALVKLGLSIKETATILNISIQGVKTARYRLRKKLGLGTKENLLHFLLEVEMEAIEEQLN